NCIRLSRFALRQCLADTQDDVKPETEAQEHLAIDEGVGLTELVPPLAVAKDGILAADVQQHGGANFAGKGTFPFRVKVLRCQFHPAVADDIADQLQIWERWAHGDPDRSIAANSLRYRLRQLLRGGGVGKHLPVAGDEFCSHCEMSFVNDE